MSNTADAVKSVYEQIGGAPAMAAAVEVFYRKVLSDDRISHFFEDVDMERQAAKQKAFLTMVTGGPSSYSGRDMRAGHAHLVKSGLNDVHFDAVAGHLKETLEELGVPAPLVARVLAIAESARADVLNR
ncbi:group I truncated hemoglobin [Pyxidicoccus xibeiensis]|uniref:group I truncated hemoglobin n=1 Tax=Pyxidicoccus xibeiensis TaxID=2906759 RepID=UPI0020A767D7|nr:group 1 truncated hemoglobin [Pyxidicoccus xibeiensis]MCP3139871.1 group 1 truncated hemoglobin [Pyxidicoccus xibeiensis]